MAGLIILVLESDIESIDMRRNILIIMALCFLATFSSCKKAPLTVGPIVTQTRELPDFNELRINDNINISLVRSDTCYIVIKSGKNIIDNITTNVSSGVLSICNTTTLNWIRPYDYELSATLYFKDIRNLIFSSSGALTTENNYTGQLTPGNFYRLEVDDGSGDLNLNISNCKEFRVVYKFGVSRLTIHGENNTNLSIYKKSYGIIDAQDYEAQSVDITNNSQGDCYINAQKTINAEINHCGNIYYKGDPDSIQVTKGPFAKGELLPLN